MKKKFLLLYASLLFISCESKKNNTTVIAEMQAPQEENLKAQIKESQLAVKKDPVCGMPAYKYLKDTALYKGKIYGFCGSGCKNKFKETPENYTAPKMKKNE